MKKANNGVKAEELFEQIILHRYGKTAFLHSLVDTKEIKGMTGTGFARASPSDYLLTVDGVMEYAEVKSCQKRVSFPFSNFTPSQNAAMVRQTAAGGKYNIYIYNITTERWYVVPASLILSLRAADVHSITWEYLEEEHMRWTFGRT